MVGLEAWLAFTRMVRSPGSMIPHSRATESAVSKLSPSGPGRKWKGEVVEVRGGGGSGRRWRWVGWKWGSGGGSGVERWGWKGGGGGSGEEVGVEYMIYLAKQRDLICYSS